MECPEASPPAGAASRVRHSAKQRRRWTFEEVVRTQSDSGTRFTVDLGCLPDAMSGVWSFSGSERLDALSGRFSQLWKASAEAGAPAFQTAEWGVEASSGPLRLVGDLRIDHPEELAGQLGQPELEGQNDGTLFLHAWQRWGEQALDRIEGDFAVAIWDARQSALTLARDAFGNRPLHFRKFPQGVAFASTACALGCIGGRTAADLERIAFLLAFVTDYGSRTFIADVERVVPGHVMTIDFSGRSRQRRWWKPRLHPVAMSPEQGVEAMRSEVDRAVAAALETDSTVVAAQLSGGHDSTMVVEAASRLVSGQKRLLAVTGRGMGEETELTRDSFSETSIARETAAMLGNVEHRIAEMPAESPLAAVDRWAASDLAPLNPFNLGWLERTYDEAREAGAKVMLVGAAGNFSVSYWGADRFSMLARGFRLPTLLREMKAYRRRYGASWFGMAGVTIGPWVPARLWMAIAARRGRQSERYDKRAFLQPRSRQVRSAMRYARKHRMEVTSTPCRALGSEARYQGMQWADFGPFNHYVRARHGVELRDPLGAKRVVELSFTLGPEHFYRDGHGRRLSKAMLSGRVPERVIGEDMRRGMQGTNWLESARLGLEDMKSEVRIAHRDRELSELFDLQAISAKLDAFPSDGWSDKRQAEAYRGLLTTTIGAMRFARRVGERDCSQ